MTATCAKGPAPGAPLREGLTADEAEWLERFYSGSHDVLRDCYENHFDGVWHAVGGLLKGADRETVVHEVFFRALFQTEQRRKFRGGAFGSWLATLARNHAIDFLRRAKKERPWDEAPSQIRDAGYMPSTEEDIDFHRFVENFKRDILPAKWLPVFELRFLRHLTQREAARVLGVGRTTLAYQELKIRRLLKREILIKGQA
jgi:RNA polymerase sigma-70 factor (ECF subfamily)